MKHEILLKFREKLRVFRLLLRFVVVKLDYIDWLIIIVKQIHRLSINWKHRLSKSRLKNR